MTTDKSGDVIDISSAMKQAADDAARPEENTPPAPPDPVPSTQATNLSPHIVHADVLANENQIKIQAYEAGIITLQSELDGAEKEKNRQIAAIEAAFAEKEQELMRRIDDLTLTKEMLTGSLVVRDRRKAERDDAAREAAFPQEEMTK